MRDPQRIDRILALIGQIWKQNPDLRLCQLLENTFEGSHCIYHKEDSNLEENLKVFYLHNDEDN